MAIRPTTKIVRKDVPAVPVPTTSNRDEKLWNQNVRERLDKLEASIVALQSAIADLRFDLDSGSSSGDFNEDDIDRTQYWEGTSPANQLVATRDEDNLIDSSLSLISINIMNRDMYVPEDYNLLFSSSAGLTGDFDITGDGYIISVA